MARRREPPSIRSGRYNKFHGKEQKEFCSIWKIHAMWYNEDKLKVIGALLASNNVDEGSPLLWLLEYTDILKLAHTCSSMHGILQRYLACYYIGKTPILELACGIGGDAFETRLEDVVHLELEKIRKVGRELSRNNPYKKTNPVCMHMLCTNTMWRSMCSSPP